MPVEEVLLDQIETALQPVAVSLTAESDASDLFEAYLFVLLLDAARAEGANIKFENVDGRQASLITLRTSPGQIWWNTKPYSHAVLSFAAKPELEAHLGIYVLGRSRVMHEADVAVLLRSEAQRCRDRRAVPRKTELIASVECKFSADILALRVARGFVGLAVDFSTESTFLVTNSRSESVAQFLTHHKRQWQIDIAPPNGPSIARIKGVFQDAFKKFKAAKR